MKHSIKPNTNATVGTANNLVLVVEDDADKRELMTGWLRANNIPCAEADTVDTAKRILQNQRIAVTLLDWVLDRSGAEVLAFCRENHAEMPVIVMTGQPHDVRTDAFLKEADSFLRHPLNETIVVSHTRRWLKRLQDSPRIMLPCREDDIVPVDEIRGTYVRHVTQLLNNNASLAAKRLGIHRQTVTSVLQAGDAAESGPATEHAPRRDAKRVAASKTENASAIRTPGRRGGRVRKGLGAVAVMAALMTASGQAQFPVLEAEDGLIAPPFVATNGYVSQASETGVTNGGRAVYIFTVTIPGEYVVAAVIKRSESISNSYYVNIDAEPVDPLMICDVPPQSGSFTNVVSWRTTPADASGKPGTKFFELSAGEHQLIVRGRSAHMQLDRFMIVMRPERPGTPVVISPPSGVRMVSVN